MDINIDKDTFTGTESPKVDSKGRIVISKIFNLKLYQKVAFLHGVDGKDCFRITSYEYLENKLNEINKMRAEASSQRDIIIYNRLIEEIERKIEELSQRRSWATSKGDTAFANHNFEEEQEYNRISSDCYVEIERIKPTLHYYESFVNDLNYHSNKKVDNDFGPTGPVR